MSANDQILIKRHKDKYFVFPDIMAESWYDPMTDSDNELHIKAGKGPYDTREEAVEVAMKLDAEAGQFGEGTEYGIGFETLIKDGASVKIIGDELTLSDKDMEKIGENWGDLQKVEEELKDD